MLRLFGHGMPCPNRIEGGRNTATENGKHNRPGHDCPGPLSLSLAATLLDRFNRENHKPAFGIQ